MTEEQLKLIAERQAIVRDNVRTSMNSDAFHATRSERSGSIGAIHRVRLLSFVRMAIKDEGVNLLNERAWKSLKREMRIVWSVHRAGIVSQAWVGLSPNIFYITNIVPHALSVSRLGQGWIPIDATDLLPDISGVDEELCWEFLGYIGGRSLVSSEEPLLFREQTVAGVPKGRQFAIQIPVPTNITAPYLFKMTPIRGLADVITVSELGVLTTDFPANFRGSSISIFVSILDSDARVASINVRITVAP